MCVCTWGDGCGGDACVTSMPAKSLILFSYTHTHMPTNSHIQQTSPSLIAPLSATTRTNLPPPTHPPTHLSTHAQVEVEYVVETRATGLEREREAERTKESLGIQERVVEVTPPGAPCP